MKTLIAPLIAELDNITDSDDIDSLLQACGALANIDSANWPDHNLDTPKAEVYVAHSGTAIYLHYRVEGKGLRAVNTGSQSPVSQDSCVEFFVAPHKDLRYWNFEINCIGTVNASHRQRRDAKTPLTDAEIARIDRYGSCDYAPFEERDGIHSWTMTVVIPLSIINVEFDNRPLDLKANFNKCASASAYKHYMSWNPIPTPTPDFHQPAHFGILTLDNK